MIHSQMHRSNQLSQLFTQLNHLAFKDSNFVQFINTAIHQISQELQVEYSDILKLHPAAKSITLVAGKGWEEAHLGHLTLTIEPNSQLSYILTSTEPVVIENYHTETRFQVTPLLQDLHIVSSISLLIQTYQQSFGILSLYSQTHRNFAVEEILFLQAVVSLFATVFERQQTLAALERTKVAEQAQKSLENQIVALMRVEAVLRESEERYALAANATNDGVWDWNLKTNEVYYSSRWKAMLGYEENEIDNHLNEWLTRLHPDDVEQVSKQVTHHCEGLTAYFESQYRLRHKDGAYRWMLSRGLAVRDSSGQAFRLAGSQSEITARKESEEKLIYHALHDDLTGLANRTLFMEQLRHAIALAERHQEYEFAVVFLDLDRFKVINDSLGHLAGDQLLITVSQRIESCLRSTDTFARFGGDEFAILLEYIQEEREAIKIVTRIRECLRAPLYLDKHEVMVNASIGVILSTTGYKQPEDLIRDADTAMYRAKAAGRGRYVVFSQEMYENAVTLLQLETDLRRAIERQEFVVFYQPVIDMRVHKITGFEALVRWQHPKRGLISPAEFIPIAEDTGLILEIGRWVLLEACRQVRHWQQQYSMESPLTISVNISRKQFSQPDLVQQVQNILRETELEPRYLKLEITESAIMDNSDAAKNMMHQLKALGIQLAMDDFGTGYSSLSHLHLFPIDTLKIDPSFIQCVDTDLEKVEIIRTVVALAWNLGIDVVAEGIETKKQMSQLKLLKCDLAQGYLFSRPLNIEGIEALLNSLPHLS